MCLHRLQKLLVGHNYNCNCLCMYSFSCICVGHRNSWSARCHFNIPKFWSCVSSTMNRFHNHIFYHLTNIIFVSNNNWFSLRVKSLQNIFFLPHIFFWLKIKTKWGFFCACERGKNVTVYPQFGCDTSASITQVLHYHLKWTHKLQHSVTQDLPRYLLCRDMPHAASSQLVHAQSYMHMCALSTLISKYSTRIDVRNHLQIV